MMIQVQRPGHGMYQLLKEVAILVDEGRVLAWLESVESGSYVIPRGICTNICHFCGPLIEFVRTAYMELLAFESV